MLCTFVESLLPEVLRHLQQPTWNGFTTAEPDNPGVRRARLQHTARLQVKATGQVFSLAVHLFDAVGEETRLHDHRYPLAVFPFAAGTRPTDGPLYEMQWVDRNAGARSVVPVRHGETWAVAHPTRIQHTVRTLQPHASVILADVTAAPTRPDRMVSTPLPPGEITRVREIIRSALQRELNDASADRVEAFHGDCGGPDLED